MKYRIILILAVMLVLGGLNNARELNDLAIVSGVGIDINDDGEYIITAQILNTKKESPSGSGTSSSSGSSQIVVYHSKSRSIQNALRNIIEESPRRLYLAHMEVLLMSEAVAKKDILQTLDFFIRDNEGSNDFMVAVTRDTTPQEILKILTPLESNPSQNIKDSITATSKYKGTSTNNTLSDNLAMILRESVPTVITSIELDKTVFDQGSQDDKKESTQGGGAQTSKGAEEKSTQEDNTQSSQGNEKQSSEEGETKNKPENQSLDEKEDLSMGSSHNNIKKEEISTSQSPTSEDKNQKIIVSCYAYFAQRELSGYLQNNDCLMRNLLQNNVKNFTLQSGIDEELIVAEAIDSKCQIIPKVEGEKYKVDIKVDLSCNIAELGSNIELKNEDSIKKCKKKIEDKVKNEIEELIQRDKEKYNCDIATLGDAFYKKMNKEYEKMKAKYGNEYFKYIDANITVDVKFPNEGGVMV